MIARIALCLLVCGVYTTARPDVDIITEPRPGEEYVLVSSGQQTSIRNFETSHKIPEKHPNHRTLKNDDGDKITKKIHNAKTKHATEGIVAIEDDKKSSGNKKGQKNRASESIEVAIPVSKIEDIKIKEIKKNVETNPKMAVALEAMSESGKLSDAPGTTTQKPVLTTAAIPQTTKGYQYIPINFDTIDDINSGLLPSDFNLETAGSEQKQHSRIQIKKGPNGQDYEYEYIYYYYDEDEDNKKEGKGKVGPTSAAPAHNSHDGPQKVEGDNHIGDESKTKNKYSTIDRTASTATPETQNEVLPASTGRSRSRGRNITPAPTPVEEENNDDISVRLPSSTRFPPRGRNLGHSSTTYVPEVSSEIVRHRGRGQTDSVADESNGQSRSRTRSHIRRPSSELVDLDSFKTNSGDIPSSYKEPPSRYSSESRSTTEEPETETQVINKESAREPHSLSSGIIFQEILDDSKLPADYKSTTSYEQDTTEYTTMTAMEKVALDLYAYLAGENLNNEINPTNAEPLDFDGSTTVDDEWTTEALSTTDEPTTTTTSTTTTTTTTTTTEAPTTTTTTPAPSTRPSRFKGRAGARTRISTTSAATEAPQETSTRTRGRFGKPGAGRKTPSTAAVEASTQASASNAEKPAQAKPFGRRGLFAGRTRPSTSAPSPASSQEEASAAPASEAPAPSRTRLRPGLRRGTTTTTTSSAPEDSTSPNASGEVAETTIAPARTLGRSRPGLRPASLRPGPRLNLRPTTRLRPSSAAPAETSEAPQETSAPEALSTDADTETSSPAPAAEAGRGRVRPNRLQLAPSPKPRVALTSQPRRPNPLLRRKPSTEATTEAAKKASAESVEESTASGEGSETETEASVAETTPAPAAPLRGLDALIARRRAAGPRPVRPARRAYFDTPAAHRV